MGNLASGHFKPTNNIQEQHNDRTLSPSYLIPQEFRGQNEVNCHSKQAMILKNQIIENAHETYLMTFKQKSQAKSYQWSLVVNTKETTTMSDLEKLAEHFEIKYGFQCYQIAIHRDEGYMDENNQPHINHHAHMEFITLNKENGKNMWGQINKVKLRQIQTEIAQILGMERGTDKRVSGTKRIEPHKYAQMKNKERKERLKDAKLIDELTSSMSELNTHATTLKQELETKAKEISTLKDTNQEQATKNQALVKEIAKLEKTNKDLQRPSLLDIINEKYIDSTKNKKEVERLQKEKEKLKEQYEEVQQERDALEKEIATALDTANEPFFFTKKTLQEAVERNKNLAEEYALLNSINPTDENAEKKAEKYEYSPIFTKFWNAIKLFYNIIEKLFGDKNAKKDHQDILNTISELQERPTRQELQAKDKEINTLKQEKTTLTNKIQKQDKTINELNQFKNSSNLALELEKSQKQVKTLESNEIALKNDLNAKESTIQAKEKELNTLKQERTDLKDKLQTQEKTINELNKKLQELEDNYRLERERMVAENKRLKEQVLEKIYTQKDYEDLKKAHHQEIEELKKEIQELEKTIKKNNEYTYTKRM